MENSSSGESCDTEVTAPHIVEEVTSSDQLSDLEGSPKDPLPSAQLIDRDKFAEHAALISKEHISEVSQTNKNKLQELMNNQVVLLESLQHENEKFSASSCFNQMEDMLSKCRNYNSKLLRIQKMMHGISLRTAKVKKQCVRLQEWKARSLVEDEEAKRRELERENLLVAQPAADSKKSPADPAKPPADLAKPPADPMKPPADTVKRPADTAKPSADPTKPHVDATMPAD
ncbi:biogenesis of lysosome-related organelles complex 1 subunit 6-like [Watersipora subatra]|uniref:biogenesis of lysosome-related organelles complex 1 subunit 6-like n=1 Tax=Watersipora subatra TaxID=2589382 RepID=UPI00355C45FA